MVTKDCLNRVLPVVADSWEKLRKCDVYRLLGQIQYDSLESLRIAGSLVTKERPEYAQAVQDAIDELCDGMEPEERCPPVSIWGPPEGFDGRKEVKPGIWRFMTAGHGGYWISESRLKAIPFDFEPFAGNDRWYEEDCDIAVIVLAFADEYDDQDVYFAFGTFKHQFTPDEPDSWHNVRDWLKDTPEGRECVARASAFGLAQQHKWQRGGSCSVDRNLGAPRGYTNMQFHRGRERRSAIVSWDTPLWVTTEELDAMEWKPAPNPAESFNEADCGGAFDGVSVTPDADPGL